MELKKITITKLQIAYHNMFNMFLGMSKYESTIYLCTVFDMQCCQSVIRKLVDGFMCRLDSYVIVNDTQATGLRFSSRIRNPSDAKLASLSISRKLPVSIATIVKIEKIQKAKYLRTYSNYLYY